MVMMVVKSDGVAAEEAMLEAVIVADKRDVAVAVAVDPAVESGFCTVPVSSESAVDVADEIVVAVDGEAVAVTGVTGNTGSAVVTRTVVVSVVAAAVVADVLKTVVVRVVVVGM